MAAVQGTTVPGTPPSETQPPVSPSLSPSTDPTASPEPSPSTDPSPSPSTDPTASPSPSPVNQQDTDLPPCQGVAYDGGERLVCTGSAQPAGGRFLNIDSRHQALPPCLPPCAGYLTSCSVWADTNADGIKGTSEPSAAVTAGQFAFAAGTAPSDLGVLYINVANEASRTVSRGLAVLADRVQERCVLPNSTCMLRCHQLLLS